MNTTTTNNNNYVRVNINNIQQNSKCRLCGDKNEIVNRPDTQIA